MKLGRSIAAHAILAIGGLVLAYLVWTDQTPALSPSAVTLVDCDPDALRRAELTTDEKDVRLTREGDVSWITVTRRPEGGEPATERFVASSALDDWLAEVAPLRANRSLGALEPAQLTEVGLAEPEGTLALRCGDRTTRFELGARAYGSGDRYLRAEGGGPVYLVSRERLAPLESAEHQLMERDLHTFAWRDVVSLHLRAFEQDKELLQHNRLDPRRAEWVDARTPDRRDETFGNWLSRFRRLRVQRYLDVDASPGADLGPGATAERVLRMDYRGEDGELGFLELERVTGAELDYYARSETTQSWVRVPSSIAAQIEEDLRAMLGVDPLERPAPPPAAPPSPSPSSPSGADEKHHER